MIETVVAVPKQFQEVVWRRSRPTFSIKMLTASSSNTGYHQTRYEVLSAIELSEDDFKALDNMGVIGFGQSYRVESESTISEDVPPVVIDKRTGDVLEGVAPTNYYDQPLTRTERFEWKRYVVLRICDSGD